MKKTITFSLFIFLSVLLNAQNFNGKLNQIAQSGNSIDWVKFRQDKQLSPVSIFNYYKEAFGLTTNDAMKVKNQENDKQGFTHYRYQQYYNNIPVRGASYIIHSKNGIAINGNGKLVKGLSINVSPQISADVAIQKAIDFTGAEKYMWESKSAENLLKKIKNNVNATYYPNADLMIANKKCDGVAANYKLVYRIEIYASKPLSKKYVFVDAGSGEVLFTENRLFTTDVEGTAVTKYAGTQKIWTDSVAPGSYRLRNTHYGNGIETYNMLTGTDYNAAVDFTDVDNYWNNINTAQDEAATDAHFAAEMTYQYYLQKFGRLSYDNNNAKLISYVHYDVAYDNAFWDGTCMTYGDGDGSSYSAFTSLDVGGHEITHAVDEYSANLIYQDESGAMNEGFSDIFGACIEFFADSANGDWVVGEDFDVQNHAGFRSLADPNAFQLPDTYLGNYWVTNDVADNGGVHTNMGPLAYWFYLVAVGDAGTNDNGDYYNIHGIGIDSAAQIAYRMLTVYLTESSTYADARAASILAAEDLYGACSNAVKVTASAFYAIGIGYPILDNDLLMSDITYPVTACGYSNVEYISARIIYNGCTVVLPAGDTIPVAYRVDGGAIAYDTLYLTNSLSEGDTLDFTFSQTVDLSELGIHNIDCWVKYLHDTLATNDSIIGFQFENKLKQNIDFGIIAIETPVSACHMTNTEHIKADMKFFGCDSIAGGATMVAAYRINGGTPVKETFTLQNTVFSGDTITHLFSTPADFSVPGNYTVDAWTEYSLDTLTSNDMFAGYVVKNPINISADTIGFEESNINNLMLVETAKHSHATINAAAQHTGGKGMQMTGGNPFDYMNELQFPDGTNNWVINEFLSAKMNFCVDATAWSTANMRFDLKQTDGGTLYTMYLGAGDYTKASNLRILVNGNQIGGTYNPTTNGSDPWATHYINLDSYAGQKFTVTIETRNISKDTLSMKMDNAYVDNVCFSELPQDAVEEYNSNLFFGIYPNPFTNEFSVKYDADKQESLSIEISDVLGNMISSRTWDVAIGSNRIELNMELLPAGIYVVKLISPKGFAVKNVVKQ